MAAAIRVARNNTLLPCWVAFMFGDVAPVVNENVNASAFAHMGMVKQSVDVR
jgi:hypothetical protein